ncbi:laminin subunit alpha-2 isoform X2 [Eupeodes corollae]|uniref:laminin subunit alpha-2 isoform X2 n=1 Tax=Eupeodes corollae TaxID=290404 RepID=UPI0024902DFC|nr:laminin subunit alpha-2 isoform X2 [Eupeodes corollae]
MNVDSIWKSLSKNLVRNLALRLLSGQTETIEGGGAFPPLFNVAPRASITVNATCGQNGREEFCKLVDAYPHKNWSTQCGICNAQSSDPAKQHPIEAILNNGNTDERWWQSPTLQYGRHFEYVTITMDLKQVYEVFFVMLKSANSPRPASWILEKSLDDITYQPWQYFGLSDADCRRRYGVAGQNGKYVFSNDTEVICTTQFSKALPLENGELHVSLLKNRPGAMEQSAELMDFIAARYIRIRFQGMHSTANLDNSVDWLLDAQSLEKRSFYSLKQIRLSARLSCHGHAEKTIEVASSSEDPKETSFECVCLHNTCGSDCGSCCPLFQDKPFRNGTARRENVCEICQCNGHATICEYDEFLGRGVCQDCRNNTAGNECEFCRAGHFRPKDSSLDTPCEECQCHDLGSVGCHAVGGGCICKDGFQGDLCAECAPGYHGENCTRCSCDSRGSLPGAECEDRCICKTNVEGDACTECKLGYFGLSADNPHGCMKCFCSGVGFSCSSANMQTLSFETLNDWKITDISRSQVFYPNIDVETGNLVYGMYDMTEVDTLYWMAPVGYTGNKLTSYGSRISLHVSWVFIRGDTSGHPTSCPNVILFGRNGLQIAFEDREYTSDSVVMDVIIKEDGWYHLQNIPGHYRGMAVTRNEFMSVLVDVESVLIRGFFHTDQVETILERATIYTGGTELGAKSTTFIEECICPPGYTGYSCENCEFGYIRVDEGGNSSSKCIPCPCNGHSNSCDLQIGNCGECMHNTFGERCERCKVGFYGNPMHGTPNDCKRCACPLAVDSNNFSPSCQLKKLSLDLNHFDDSEYVCTQCPTGYTGDHCEMCDDGYYGNPTEIGSQCLPCPCDGGPCDIFTGKCITCSGNTEGWHCERCKMGYWGDPAVGCESCDCYAEGSDSDVCDSVNGQCLCKPRFGGQKCDECEIGFADVDLMCPPCECDLNGSHNDVCDPFSGQCSCKLGVTGLKCDECADEYFGLEEDGCEECLCNPIGAITLICEKRSGQCPCLSNVTGRRCDKCRPGHWNLTAGNGCFDCRCDPIGSRSNECNPWTGQCDCKIGISGQRCDQCQEGFYGFNSEGCIRCDPCPVEGQVCDTFNGRCICPPNSRGLRCSQCVPGTWGWQNRVGCINCDCDMIGSIGQMCDEVSGQCVCREGYAGRKCETCAVGYFGYPECRRCNCDVHGSFVRPDGLIACDTNGQCPCKALVIGLKCDTCRQGTFGLSNLNPEGCTRCFCFGRSDQCAQSEWSWGHIRMPGSRNLSIQYMHPSSVPNSEFEYIVIIQMEGSKSYREDAELSSMNNLNLIPKSTGNISIGAYTTFYYPLYFQLPPQFYGDRTSSYGGNLVYTLLTDGGGNLLDRKILLQFPLVQIHSHSRLIIDFYEYEERIYTNNDTFSVPLHESYWKLHQNGHDVDRSTMMAALQNIKHIFLRGTTTMDFVQVIIQNVHMDTAIYIYGSTNMIAKGVERCKCPKMYEGLSCQDPGAGYYRWKNNTEIHSTFIEDLIGRAAPCHCNGRSTECDRETGVCLNCRGNTGGDHCDRCAEGFYGDPNIGSCRSCPCPETSRNFAKGCTVWNGEVSCICRPGYTGALCDRCRPGFFGSPRSINGTCRSCDCNLDGIALDECNSETGQCHCKPGVTGRKCDVCVAERHFLEDRRCKLCDNCTLTLLDYVELIGHKLRRGMAHMDLTGIPAPWLKLDEYEENRLDVTDQLQDYTDAKRMMLNYDDNTLQKLGSYAENNKFQSRKAAATAAKRTEAVTILRKESADLYSDIGNVRSNIINTIFALNNYGTEDHHMSLPAVLQEARYYLHQIQQHDESVQNIRGTWSKAWDLFYLHGNASDAAFDLRGRLEMFMRDLNNTNYRLSDARMFTDKTFEMLNEIDDIHEHIVNLKSYLVEDHGQIRELQSEFDQYENNSLVAETDTFLDMIEGRQEQLDGEIDTIERLSRYMNDTLEENDKIRKEVYKHWLPKAQKHAARLTERSNEYMRQFQPTKNGARIALLASSAHKNISDAITAARRSSLEAREGVSEAQNQLYPSDGSSVIERAKISLGKSKLLQKDALREMEKANVLKMKIKIHEDEVEGIKSRIIDAGIRTNNISSMLSTLNTGASKKMALESIEMATRVSEQMNAENRKALDVNDDILRLREKFNMLEPDFAIKLGMAEENISLTKTNIRLANISLNFVEEQTMRAHQKFEVWNDTMSKQMQELRDKIAKARHAAEGIKVSIESADPKCVRSYLPSSYGLSTSNSIKLSFALNNVNGNSPLIYIQGRDGRYIAMDMYKRRVRLKWNLGGSTETITHPLEIQTRDPHYDDAWYHVEANRTLNIGSLLVRRMTNVGTLAPSIPVTGVTDLEYTRFFRTTADKIWIGGYPSEAQIRDPLVGEGLNVILHQVQVDNKPLGLWNFAHSEGKCGGAMSGAQESAAMSNARYFNGLGYAEVKKSRPRPYRKNLFALQMTFRTLDENALLFLAVDDKNNRSVSVTLSRGRILFRIDYGDESKLEINTTKKYNSGKWIKIEAAREFVPKRGTENGSLRVNNDTPITGSPTVPIKSHMLPDLSKAVYYLGGVPPGFRSGSTKAPGADNPFMGCMMDVQINGETYDPLGSSTYFGVEQSCKDTVTKAGFTGSGFVELSSQSLRKRSNTGFVFRTLQPNTLLLLSAYPPEVSGDYDSKDIKGNYSISVLDGLIHVWIDSGRSNVKLVSNSSVNDGEYHVVNLIKNGRKFDLMVDDELQDSKILTGSPTMVSMPREAGGLYVGGAPENAEYKPLAPTLIPLEGAIRDIVFNNKTVNFNQALSFSNVQIGRNGPQMGSFNGMYDVLMKTEPIGKSFTTAPEGCQRVGSYSYEPNAFKFGDNHHSYSQLNLQARNFWQRNFHIDFDFRSFYPNGLIFLAPGTKEKQKHYVSLLLKDGHLLLIVRGRRREELQLTAKLNNGEWHHVIINCQDRKVTMSVEIGTTDQKTSAQMKVPKKISASSSIYVGGLPEQPVNVPNELALKLEGFKGCLRKMNINGTTQDLARPGKHLNVGQCFPKVEKGSYFPGDAYAIYKKNFHVGKYLELELEFRTSELNGILLSVSEPNGFPALSLEIHTGNVILSCDLGDGNPFRVQSILPSKYAICDNKWHNISALYDFEQIALRIDNHPAIISLAQHRVSGKVQTKSALYIGGVPDIAPSGTLLTRENFKGCIRNVSIRNERRDWIDMDGLHNVLLSECLVVN